MAHYGKRTKKSSYTQTLHLKPFAAGFSRKNWKGNLLTGSRLCFGNRLGELSLSNLGSRSQVSAGGTWGSCPVRDAGITDWQQSRGRWFSDMTCASGLTAIPARGSAQPITALAEQVFWGPSPGQSLPKALPGEMLRLCPSSGCQSRLTPAVKVTCLLCHVSKTWKGEVTSGKMVPQAREQENSCDLRTRLSIPFLPCSLSCPNNEMKGT